MAREAIVLSIWVVTLAIAWDYEEKEWKAADFLNCFQMFHHPQPRFTQLSSKVSAIQPEIKVFSLEGMSSVDT